MESSSAVKRAFRGVEARAPAFSARMTELLRVLPCPIAQGDVIPTGLVVGRINEVPGCDEPVQRMVFECRQRLVAAQAMFVAP
jgi:hypothetical protein